MKPLVLCLPLLLLSSACTHSVHQIATGGLESVPVNAKVRTIEAEAEQTVILYLSGNTDFADDAYRQLLAQCPGGEIRGIEARHSTSHGFLSFTNTLKAKAFCVE